MLILALFLIAVRCSTVPDESSDASASTDSSVQPSNQVESLGNQPDHTEGALLIGAESPSPPRKTRDRFSPMTASIIVENVHTEAATSSAADETVDPFVLELEALLSESTTLPRVSTPHTLPPIAVPIPATPASVTEDKTVELSPWSDFAHVDPAEVAPETDDAIAALAQLEILDLVKLHTGRPCQIGKYFQTVKKLGMGAFGLALLCKVSGRGNIALKLTASDSCACEEVHALKVITAAKGRLPNHKGVPRMVDFLGGCPLSATVYCMVFEPLGLSLRDILNYNKCGFHLEDIQAIGYDVLHALDFLHLNRYVHTDIKPENILLTRKPVASHIPLRFVPLFAPLPTVSESVIRPVKDSSGVMIKVIDLGNAHAPSDVTASTLPYRSPEALRKKRWTYATDMWSVGCLLGELCIGRYLIENLDDADPLNEFRIQETLTYGLERKVSPHCRELYTLLSDCMLIEDPKIRETPVRAARHSFFTRKGRLESHAFVF